MEKNQNCEYDIFINIELLFEIRGILWAITRFLNNRINFLPTPKQDFFKNLKYTNIEEYLSEIKSKVLDESKFPIDQLRKELKSNFLYSTIKPKLFFLDQLRKLLNTLKFSNLFIFSRDNSFIDNIQNTVAYKEFINLMNVDNMKNFILVEYFDLKNKFIKPSIICDLSIDVVKEFDGYTKEITFYYIKDENNKEERNIQNVAYNKLNGILELIGLKELISDNSKEKTEFIYKYEKLFLNHDFSYLKLWDGRIEIQSTVISEKIISGFQRGSKLLGVPTTNLCTDGIVEEQLKDIYSGVYYGYFKFSSMQNELLDNKYKAVLSIGYNPFYELVSPTIEIFLIDYEGDDFYGEYGSLTIIGYIRPEANFDNFQELVTAITYDIIEANKILT
jgi:hypothetical protein